MMLYLEIKDPDVLEGTIANLEIYNKSLSTNRDLMLSQNWSSIGRAQNTFVRTLAESNRMEYAPSVELTLNSDANFAVCQAQALVPL